MNSFPFRINETSAARQLARQEQDGRWRLLGTGPQPGVVPPEPPRAAPWAELCRAPGSPGSRHPTQPAPIIPLFSSWKRINQVLAPGGTAAGRLSALSRRRQNPSLQQRSLESAPSTADSSSELQAEPCRAPPWQLSLLSTTGRSPNGHTWGRALRAAGHLPLHRGANPSLCQFRNAWLRPKTPINKSNHKTNRTSQEISLYHLLIYRVTGVSSLKEAEFYQRATKTRRCAL